MDNEKQLVELARNGDRSAFRSLVDEHKRNVYYLALDLTGNKEDAEDVSQDVFVKAFRSLKKFRGDSKFGTWIYRITVNTCYSMKRKKWYTATKPEEDMSEVVDNTNEDKREPADDNPERKTESGFIKKHVDKAIQKLSERERSVFVLRNVNELPFDEIVKIMKLRPGTVRALNFRALKKLRSELSFYKNEF